MFSIGGVVSSSRNTKSKKQAADCQLLQPNRFKMCTFCNRKHRRMRITAQTRNGIFNHAVQCVNVNGCACLTVQFLQLLWCCRFILENNILQCASEKIVANGNIKCVWRPIRCSNGPIQQPWRPIHGYSWCRVTLENNVVHCEQQKIVEKF